MNRQAQAVVLLLLGGAVLKASVTDIYLRYVKEGLRPFLIVAGIMLVAAAVMTLGYDLRRGAPDAGADDGGCGYDGPGQDGSGYGGPGQDGPGQDPRHDRGRRSKGHREPRVGWLLVLPVLGLLLVAPPALGSYAAGQAGTALSSQRVSDFPPLPAGDPVRLGVLDYASRAVFDDGASLGDRRVQLTGFIAAGPGDELIMARMVLSCCAADGRPIKLGMTGNRPTGLALDTWIEVVGRYTNHTGADPVNGEQIPYIEVETWREIEPPKQQYE